VDLSRSAVVFPFGGAASPWHLLPIYTTMWASGDPTALDHNLCLPLAATSARTNGFGCPGSRLGVAIVGEAGN
jgi:hypothetical protein